MERNAYFDNAKLLLIFLVVFGHAIQPFTSENRFIDALYIWIYTFHMPAFIFLAGFFAKGLWNVEYVLRLMKRLIVPYVIFQSIYTLFYYLIGKDDWQMGHLFDPQWSLWFLLSLFSWHLMLVLYKRIRPFLGVAIAALTGIFVGYFDSIGHDFSLSRTFVFFPFFLLGYWLNETHIAMLKRRAMKLLSLIIMFTTAISLYYLPEINPGWFLASHSYAELGAGRVGGLLRLAVYITSAVMIASIFAWIPKRRFKMTTLGERTIYVYLLHGFIIQPIRQFDLLHVTNVFELIGVAVLSVIIVYLLSSQLVITVFQPLIELNISRMKSCFRQYRESQHY